MPRLASDAVARILERVMLQTTTGDTDASPPREQTLQVARHEVRERFAVPEVSMEPEAAAHGVDHPFAAVAELDPIGLERRTILRWREWREWREWRTTGPAH